MTLVSVHAHPEFFVLVLLQVLCLGTFALGVGSLLGLRGLTALGWGAFIIFAASYLSYEACRALALSLSWFVAISGGLTYLLITGFRRARPFKPYTPSHAPTTKAMAWVGLGTLTLAIVWMRTLSGFSPNASAQFFQGWDPLYIRASVSAGHFIPVEDMGFGEGFLTSALHYAPNTRGLTTLLALAGFPNEYAGYVATSSFALAAGLAALVDALRDSRVGIVVFIVLFLAFAAAYQPLTNHIFGASSDEMLFFAAALAANCLHSPSQLSAVKRWTAVFAALAIGTAGRNYGAFFAVIALGPLGFLLWQRRGTVRPDRFVLGLGFILVTPEVLKLCLAGDIYYPRQRLPELFPWSWERFATGTLCDWGVIYERSAGAYGPSVLGFHVLALLVAAAYFLRERRPLRLLRVSGPWLFLLLPMLLEIMSGFRKDVAYSKIYLGAAWVFAWMPAHIIRELLAVSSASIGRAPRQLGLGLAVTALVIIFVLLGTGHGHGYYRFFSGREILTKLERWWQAGSSGIDENVARLARNELVQYGLPPPEKWRVMYFHYEPGISLRWHMGGDFFNDLDFWSDPVQSVFHPGMGVEEFLNATGRPALYLSLGTQPRYQPFVEYPLREQFWAELKNWENLNCFAHAIETDGAVLLIPR